MMQEDFSIYNGEGTTLRRAQLRMLDILRVVDSLCKKYNIDFKHTGEPMFDDDDVFTGLEEEDVCFKDKDSGIEIHLEYK
jgi:hypothetical protein